MNFYRATTNSDLSEGRGHTVILHVTKSLCDAYDACACRGVQGEDGQIDVIYGPDEDAGAEAWADFAFEMLRFPAWQPLYVRRWDEEKKRNRHVWLDDDLLAG